MESKFLQKIEILDKKIRLEDTKTRRKQVEAEIKERNDRNKSKKEMLTRTLKGSPIRIIPKGWSRRATVKLRRI
jgi:hypothetical protein